MRLCRFDSNRKTSIGFYSEQGIIPLTNAAKELGVTLPDSDSVLAYLPGGDSQKTIQELNSKIEALSEEKKEQLSVSLDDVKLLVPIADPKKIMLLAGNYSKHIEEGGGRAEERSKTFPYLFMKPPTTTLTHPNDPVKIPVNSPDHIDWELELAIVIGKKCSHVKETDALKYVAGYTIINDISDRLFRPNPDRNERSKDGFFDWLHGKWHDTFCPMGPCIVSADDVPDPQTLKMNLKVNDSVEQDATTGEMIFPVAAIIEFVSSITTLEPGDVISTGTPEGVGVAKGKFLKPGDVMYAEIEKIGVLTNPVI